jgi:D-alanyl-D-alanine carboxypeptidase/D-alanyl-D-alanine-endopeptidase (penicillin-binding protein 4)
MPQPSPAAPWRRRRTRLALAALAAPLLLAGAGALGPPAASGGGEPAASGPTATIARVQAQPRYRHSTWGLAVADLASGEILIGQRADKLFVPGSIMKTYATVNALDAYGPGYRFRTPVYRQGPLRNGTVDGNLVLVASGDFSMGLRDRPNGTLAFNSAPQIDHNYADTGLPGAALVPRSNPLAGLDDLAAQVRAAGVRRVAGDVVIDDRLFASYDGWPDGRISPIWVNENVLDITVKPAAPGRPARVDWRPKTAAWRVERRVTTGPAGSAPALTIRRVAPGVVRIGGSVPAGGGPVLQVFQIPDPAAFARTALIEALRRQGVAVAAPATGRNPRSLLPRGRAYPASRRVALRVSPPLSEYTKVILKVSYNRGADLMVCLAAVATGSRDCAAGIVREVRTNAALGAGRRTTFPFDGAGSVEQDRTTPLAMVRFLRRAAGQPYGGAFRAGLPILGVDGTLADVGVGTPGAGRIQAKTGTRAGVTDAGQTLLTGNTHVGYIRARSGRELVFADMVRDVPLPSVAELHDIEVDLATIEAAIQRAY